MVTALKSRGRSIHFHLSSLREGSHQKSIVFLQDSRLLSRRIFHKHHFHEPFRMLIPYRRMSTDRIGTFAPVPIRSVGRSWRLSSRKPHPVAFDDTSPRIFFNGRTALFLRFLPRTCTGLSWLRAAGSQGRFHSWMGQRTWSGSGT